MNELVRLGYNKATKTAWLELRNTPYLIRNSQDEGVDRYLIGAVNRSRVIGANDDGGQRRAYSPSDIAANNTPHFGWVPIQPQDTAGGTLVQLTQEFDDCYQVLNFQKAIIDSWDAAAGGLAPGSLSGLVKGTAVGKSFTSASFVAKALKTGFDAIGHSMAAKPKFTAWTIDDLLHYATRRAPAFHEPGLQDFQAFEPSAMYSYDNDPIMAFDDRHIEPIKSTLAGPVRGGFTYENELRQLNGIMDYERITAYGFRGDARPPGFVKGAGGFLPNYTRPAHIEQHQEKLRNARRSGDQTALDEWNEAEGGALNLVKFLEDQTLMGFVSASKSIAIAKRFATSRWVDGLAQSGQVVGWIYACLMVGAIHIPRFFRTSRGMMAEQELTMPGMIDWDNVVACREVLHTGMFKGPVYMRRSLQDRDSKPFKKIYKLLSGKSQTRPQDNV
jgi:hypothetical protein